MTRQENRELIGRGKHREQVRADEADSGQVRRGKTGWEVAQETMDYKRIKQQRQE